MRGRWEIALLAGYGALAAVLFGTALNLSFWPFLIGSGTEISFVAGAPVGENLHRFLLYSVATSLPWDLGRAITTAVGITVAGYPVLATLRRAARRAAFGPVAESAPARTAGS
ncbi:ECF transporter S component [Occultella aeris]|uniref:ECF transporter S component n=1 Tax=Occultella aeris TaxID=2761496 RepID=A0A7M4DKY1_9MICO|nr:hypothetical protein HALOF300_02796 [Occultella aeris]